jgi:hypothetical protein
VDNQTVLRFGMARWMAEHEVLAAAIFVGLSLALTALFAILEYRYKERLTGRHKNTSHKPFKPALKSPPFAGGPHVPVKKLLSVLLLCGCALGHNLSGVFR